MSYSIYEPFLTINDCKYYCNQIAKRLNLNVFDYFYDNRNQIQFPGDSNLYNFNVFKCYEDWQIKFNLTRPKTIMKMGLDEYVFKYHELKFNLTIKGFSFLYICRFSANNYNETANINTNDSLYIEETDTHQLCFVL